MHSKVGKKLIAVAGINKLLIFQAKNGKISHQIADIDLPFDRSNRPEKHESRFGQKATPDSLFDPRTTPEELERAKAAKAVSDEIENLIKEGHQEPIILVAEPRTLGFLRKHLSEAILKQIEREIIKDLLRYTQQELEEAVFSDI